MRPYVDGNEVAARTGSSPWWARALARRGALPCLRRGPGCRPLCDPAAAEAALAAGSPVHPPPVTAERATAGVSAAPAWCRGSPGRGT